MEHFPPKDTVSLTEPEIAPHFAEQPARSGAPNHSFPSHRSFPEETTLGKDHYGQDHSRQSDDTNTTLWHESPPPRTQITYPTLPPSPPALPASKPTYPLPHHSESSMCPTRDCGWRTAYLTLRRMVKKMMDEKEDNVREIRWAVDDMERKMHSEAEFLDESDGRWRDCERAPDAEEGAGESLGGMGSEVACGVESFMGGPPRDGGDGFFDRFVYPDLRSDLAPLEKAEDRLGALQGVGGEVVRGIESSAGDPPRVRAPGRVLYPTLPSVVFRGDTVVDRLA